LYCAAAVSTIKQRYVTSVLCGTCVLRQGQPGQCEKCITVRSETVEGSQRVKRDALKGLFKGKLTRRQEGALRPLVQEEAYKEKIKGWRGQKVNYVYRN
jgi:hypothetical protein